MNVFNEVLSEALLNPVIGVVALLISISALLNLRYLEGGFFLVFGVIALSGWFQKKRSRKKGKERNLRKDNNE